MELKDRELAIRWWNRRDKDKQIEILISQNVRNRTLESLTGSEIEYIWKKANN